MEDFSYQNMFILQYFYAKNWFRPMSISVKLNHYENYYDDLSDSDIQDYDVVDYDYDKSLVSTYYT